MFRSQYQRVSGSLNLSGRLDRAVSQAIKIIGEAEGRLSGKEWPEPRVAKENGFSVPEPGFTNEDLYKTRYPLGYSFEKKKAADTPGEPGSVCFRDVSGEISMSEFNDNIDKYEPSEPWTVVQVLNALWPNINKQARHYASASRWKRSREDSPDSSAFEDIISTIRYGLLRKFQMSDDHGGNFISWITSTIYSAASAGIGRSNEEKNASGLLIRLIKAGNTKVIDNVLGEIDPQDRGEDVRDFKAGNKYGRYAPKIFELGMELRNAVEAAGGKKPKKGSSSKVADFDDDDDQQDNAIDDVEYKIKTMWADVGGGKENITRMAGALTGLHDTISVPHSESSGQKALRQLLQATSGEDVQKVLDYINSLKDPNSILDERAKLSKSTIESILGGDLDESKLRLSKLVSEAEEKEEEIEDEEGEEDEDIAEVSLGKLINMLLRAFESKNRDQMVYRVKLIMKDWIDAKGGRDVFRSKTRRADTMKTAEGDEVDPVDMIPSGDDKESKMTSKEVIKELLEVAYIGRKMLSTEPDASKRKLEYDVPHHKIPERAWDKSQQGAPRRTYKKLTNQQLRILIRLFGISDYPARGILEPLYSFGSKVKHGAPSWSAITGLEEQNVMDVEFDSKIYKEALNMLKQTIGGNIEDAQLELYTPVEKNIKAREEILNRPEDDPNSLKESFDIPSDFFSDYATGEEQPEKAEAEHEFIALKPHALNDMGNDVQAYGFEPASASEAAKIISMVAEGSSSGYEEQMSSAEEEYAKIEQLYKADKIVPVIAADEDMADSISVTAAYSKWVRRGAPQLSIGAIAKDLGKFDEKTQKIKPLSPKSIQEPLEKALGSVKIQPGRGGKPGKMQWTVNRDSTLALTWDAIRDEFGYTEEEFAAGAQGFMSVKDAANALKMQPDELAKALKSSTDPDFARLRKLSNNSTEQVRKHAVIELKKTWENIKSELENKDADVRGFVDVQTAAKVLDIDPTEMVKELRKGTDEDFADLKRLSNNNVHQLRKAAVLDFRQKLVTVEEAAKMLQMQPEQLSRELENGKNPNFEQLKELSNFSTKLLRKYAVVELKKKLGKGKNEPETATPVAATKPVESTPVAKEPEKKAEPTPEQKAAEIKTIPKAPASNLETSMNRLAMAFEKKKAEREAAEAAKKNPKTEEFANDIMQGLEVLIELSERLVKRAAISESVDETDWQILYNTRNAIGAKYLEVMREIRTL